MANRTEMLEASDKIDYRITEVLQAWVKNEGNNLQSFIDNPTEHVNYNPYMIMDFDKLRTRLGMLRNIENSLVIITEYKKGSENYTRTMYESSIDIVNSQLFKRLYDWLQKRFEDMTKLVADNKVDEYSPIRDYVGMFSFDANKFGAEYNMYYLAIQGCKVILEYKLALEEEIHADANLSSNEPPLQP